MRAIRLNTNDNDYIQRKLFMRKKKIVNILKIKCKEKEYHYKFTDNFMIARKFKSEKTHH
jgi:hypothetical protein